MGIEGGYERVIGSLKMTCDHIIDETQLDISDIDIHRQIDTVKDNHFLEEKI